MKYVKIKNSVVIQTQPNEQDGFVRVEDNISCGMIYNEDGTFVTPSETQEQINQQRLFEIDILLDKIDKESIRPLRSKLNGNGNQTDDDKLLTLGNEAELLRIERGTLV